MKSLVGSVIQANGMMKFEDGSRIGNPYEVRKSLQKVQTIPEINVSIDFRVEVDQVPRQNQVLFN